MLLFKILKPLVIYRQVNAQSFFLSTYLLSAYFLFRLKAVTGLKVKPMYRASLVRI